MDFGQVLSAYRSFDPAGWVALYRVMPTWLGIPCGVLGIVLLLVGGGRLFRVVAAPVGALLGYLWAPLVAARFGVQLPEHTVAVVAALGVGLASFAVPPTAVFVGFGLPAGFAAGDMAGANDWMLGFLPGFLAVGTLAAVFSRWIAAVVASAVGAWLLMMGLLSGLHVLGVAATVAAQPWGVLLGALLLAIAGSIYQLFVRPSPEDAERLKQQRQKLKQRIVEKRALEKRWGVPANDD